MDDISLLTKNKVILYDELKDYIPSLNFDIRERVEDNADFLQSISVAVITNINTDSVLVIKKNDKAVLNQNSLGQISMFDYEEP